jgi:hypothetical protein
MIVTYKNYMLWKWIRCIEDCELLTAPLMMAQEVPKHVGTENTKTV